MCAAINDNLQHRKFEAVAVAEFERLKQRIADNIRRTGKWASGKTAESMRVEVETTETSTEVSLLGRKGFEYLETGNPPRERPLRDFARTLYEWSRAKGIPFRTDGERLFFATRQAFKINEYGDRQYRSGQRARVFTEVSEESLLSIEEAVASEVAHSATALSSQIANELFDNFTI